MPLAFLTHFPGAVGRGALSAFGAVGRVVIFAFQTLCLFFSPPFYGRALGTQMLAIGYYSLPVVGLTALFTGAAVALQIHDGGARFNAESVVPSILAIGMVRELGPVLAGLMVAGRVSGAIAAELGTMRVSEQIDALITLSTNPIRYLVVPRLIAAIISLPLLVLIADIIGILGGYLVGTNLLGFAPANYINTTFDYLERFDVLSGLIKAAIFGALLALMGCYHGYHASDGARGVGKATTDAVVSACVLILAANFLLTNWFFAL